jgi:hypothetical protein
MTYYKAPAPSNETYIHSGFSLWFYQRAQLQQLVDYVLQSMWGMTKGPVPRRTSSSRAVSASAAAGSTRPLSAKTLLAPAPRFPRD